ncbi:MAG TPA: glycosyltransferase, partial [Azospirillaceae bacterium]|nr:glycosyltransferase [Azospirillaceae bacterium]
MAKCAWSPELCLARDDVSAFLALRRGWRGRAEPPLPDLLVRELFERGPAGVRHLPIPLSDREPGLAPLDLAPAAAAWYAGQGLRVEGEGPEARRVLPAAGPGRVSVIVATHEQPLLLRRCLAALEATAGGPGLELLLIDHDNRSEAARSVIEAAAGRPGTRVLPRSGVFNYAAFMNEAARAATGDVLLFLNDDTEALAPGWLEEMAAHAVRPGIGAVGAKLLYPDRTVQHGGVVLLGAAGAAHLGTGLGADDPGPGGRLRHLGGISAVTGAAMAVERRRFEAAGGFDDRYFAVNYNDVDLCLKLGQAGLRTLVAPRAVLVHHESATRRRDSRDGRMLEGGRELHALISRWDLAGRPDPFYNPNLDGRDRTGALAVPPRQALPWRTRDLDLAALAERARATGRRRGRGQADFDLALAAYRMGRLEEAAAAVRRAVDASRPGDRDFGAMLNLAGMVAERRDRMDEAEAFLRRAVAAEPGRVEFRHNLGNFLARRRRVEEAAACWSQVLADNPHFLESRISLAVALLALGRPAEALAQAVRGLEAEPAHAKLLPAAARAARQAGNPGLALAFLERLRASPGRPPDLDREIAAAEAEAAKDPRPAPAAALPEPRPGGIVLLAAVGGDAEPDALADALAGAARDGAAVVAVAGAETPEPVLARLRAALAGTPALLLEGIPSADRAALLNVALAAAEGGHVAAVDDPARLDRRTLRLLACGAAAPDAPDVVAAVPLPRALAGAVTPAPGHAGLEWLAGGPAVLAVRTDLAARLGGVSAGCGGQELYELGLRALAAAPGPAVLTGIGTPGDAAAAPVPAPVLARRRDAFLRRYAARDGGAAVGGAGTLLSVPPAPATVSIIPVGPVGPAWADAAADALWPRDPRSPLEVVDPSSDRVVAYQGDAVRIAGAGPGAGTGADGLAGLVGQCGGDVLVFADP